ncbi:MAG: carboxypeptidase regulatory-like domain-containing protein [Acidobacteria bacterium]|nr:carboxypeptidase regulatory-like domain-containing protein [Acidobacteriota bacterium]
MKISHLCVPTSVRTRKHCLRGLIISGTLLVAASVSAFAQEGTIIGTVTDPSGAAVPNVSITVTNSDTGQISRFNTNDVGQYVAPDLRIGHYSVRAQGANFKAAEQTSIQLAVGDRRRVDFQLQLGSAQENVTVEATAAAVQSDSGEISDVVTGPQITQLATNGRSIAELEALVPGASSAQGDFQVPTSAGGDFTVSINGQRVVHNLWLVDGGEAADRGGGGGADVLPSEEAIAEFRTLTSNYSAEYGLSSAGTMSMVIKSGTKQLHAEAFYFGRNDALDARNYFNPAPQKVTELRFNDWGFNVGGPVAIKSQDPKTFFFYNMEWRRYIKGGLFNVNVPLASMYPDANGANTGVVLPSTQANGKPVNVVAPANIAALAAAGGCAAGTFPAAGQPFANNTIPDCLISANANALLGAGIFPKPSNGWTFIGGGNQPTTGKEEIARIDHRFSDKFSVFGHFIADQAIQTYGTTQWSGDNVPSVGNTFNNPSYSYVIHATHVIRPNLLNEISFNYDGNRIHILPQGVFKAPSGFTFNRIFTGTNVDNRVPDINLTQIGSNYTVNWLPWNNTADDYQVRDDISWVKGAHQFKFGGGWAIYKKVQDYFAETQGGFTFDGSASGFDYADFILGDAQHYSENAYKGTGYWNAISPHAYFQDNWRATHRLTLNLGLRWDAIPHTYEANHNQTNFYPNLYNPANAPIWVPGSNFGQIAANSPGLGQSPVPSLQGYSFYLNGMGTGGRNGIPKGLANDKWWNFGPRLGFAYDLAGNGKTIIRAGYGLMYERIQGNDMYNGATNPPFGYSLGTTDVLLANPHTQWSGGSITVPIVPASVTGINQNYPAPRVSQYSAGVQQALFGNAVLSVSYVGSVDRHQSYWQELNLPPASDLVCLTAGNCPAGTPAFNGLVPYQGYTQIKQAFNGGNSHYNSLQTELRGRLTKDLQLQVAYTYSKSVDPTTGNGGNGWDLNYVSNPYVGWKYDVGPSVFDRPHVAFVNFIYDIPFLRNSSNRAMKTLIGGWTLSGIITAESGIPFNVGLSGHNVASVFPGGDVANRPDLTGQISYPKTQVLGSNGAVTGIQWVNPAAFATPTPGAWGNLPFDAVRGPGRDDWNLSLSKSFLLSESRGSRFEFRADAFNAWNHTQFGGGGQNGGFSNNFGSGNFGQMTSAFDAREFQLGARLIF